MSPTLVNIAKVAMVFVLYGFLWVVARAVRTHLSPAPGGRSPNTAHGSLVFAAPPDRAGAVIDVARPVVVGRGAGVDVAIDDPFASDRHARFDRVGGRLVVEDLGSKNGTLVNGVAVIGHRVLERGDAISIGQTIMEVR